MFVATGVVTTAAVWLHGGGCRFVLVNDLLEAGNGGREGAWGAVHYEIDCHLHVFIEEQQAGTTDRQDLLAFELVDATLITIVEGVDHFNQLGAVGVDECTVLVVEEVGGHEVKVTDAMEGHGFLTVHHQERSLLRLGKLQATSWRPKDLQDRRVMEGGDGVLDSRGGLVHFGHHQEDLVVVGITEGEVEVCTQVLADHKVVGTSFGKNGRVMFCRETKEEAKRKSKAAKRLQNLAVFAVLKFHSFLQKFCSYRPLTSSCAVQLPTDAVTCRLCSTVSHNDPILVQAAHRADLEPTTASIGALQKNRRGRDGKSAAEKALHTSE